jgi:flagellar biosynthesis anti-sigma factor FlgM
MSNSINQVACGALSQAPDAVGSCGAAKPAGPAGAPTSALDVNPLDQTQLSQLGQVLDTAVRSAGGSSSFRPALVAQLRGAIANGSYQPDLSRLAGRVAQVLGASSGAGS